LVTLQTNPIQILSDSIDLVSNHSGLYIDAEVRQDLLFYFTELHTWNKTTNLTGIKDPRDLVFKHLGDTNLLLKIVPETVKTVLDIGTGAGVPGLVMKMIRPELKMVLAEAAKKKCSFLRFVSADLNLKGIYIEEGMLKPTKAPSHMPEGGFDLIITQATGSIRWFAQTGSGFLAPSGRMIILKGPSVQKEMEEALNFLDEKGFCFHVHRARLPVLEHPRSLIELWPKAVE